jgi:myo-inositol 2-dehydrogenase/D-chiro-inositol 1-dehydrogenase
MKKLSGISRRQFVRNTAAASAGLAVAGLGTNFAFAQASDKLRIGLIGCGGRGTGAAGDCLLHNDNVELVAMGDAFKDHLDACRGKLKESLGEKYKVADDHAFVGLDAYKKVLASDIDLVILATPPGFRPIHIAAAVDAGKHIFAEKPVATDPTGIRSVMESAKKIKEKKLAFVTGTQRRHQVEYIETIKRIHDGAIGELVRVADAELVLLHLDLRRPHRRAARPQRRRHELVLRRAARQRLRHGRSAGAYRSALWPYL